MMQNKSLSSLVDSFSIVILGFFFLVFPFVFSSLTTDAFYLPKQILLAVVALVSLVLFAVKLVASRKLKIRRTPFDLPVILFALILFVGALLSVNRPSSLIAYFPVLFSVFIFFAIVNLVRNKAGVLFLSGSLLGGAAILSVVSALSMFKIYILPWDFAKQQAFSPFGSLFDQAVYLLLILCFALYISFPTFKKLYEEKRIQNRENIFFAACAVIVALGVLASLYGILKLQKPALLPFETGFQTAFAAISQDTGRTLLSFLFGSGYGTFITDFTRFKLPAFNLNADIWNLYFFRSSSFVLELLATTGVLGLASFLFIILSVIRTNRYYLPLIVAAVLAFILPFSFTSLFLFFVLLAIFAIHERHVNQNKTKYSEFEFGLIASDEEFRSRNLGAFLPGVFLIIIVLLVGLTTFPTFKYVVADLKFAQSLTPAAQTNGVKVYELQRDAINTFPYRDDYQRVFSQTNLALANAFAQSVPKGSSPSAQLQNNISTLIQQSINSGRSATTIAALDTRNWQNLSSVYRSLIGFGQNADSFAILTNQQAATLDPSNPQEYVNLGGIFFQLKQWDNAIRQFQAAVNLKPDYANAYYNLGHAYEAKGDLQTALATYKTVANLMQGDKTNLAKINKEIKALEAKVGTGQEGKDLGQATNQPDLNVASQAATLPTQNPPVKIPAPSVSPVASPTPSPSPAPSLAP